MHQVNQNILLKHRQLLNCILLNARFLIYSCKYSKCKPNLNLLFVALQHVKNLSMQLRNETILFLDIYINGPYKLIYVIVIFTVFIYISFICNKKKTIDKQILEFPYRWPIEYRQLAKYQ